MTKRHIVTPTYRAEVIQRLKILKHWGREETERERQLMWQAFGFLAGCAEGLRLMPPVGEEALRGMGPIEVLAFKEKIENLMWCWVKETMRPSRTGLKCTPR